MKNVRVKTLLLAMTALLIATPLGAGGVILFELGRLTDSVSTLGSDVTSTILFDTMVRGNIRAEVALSDALLAEDRSGDAARVVVVAEELSAAESAWAELQASGLDQQDLDAARRWWEVRENMASRAIRPSAEALRAGDAAKARRIYMAEANTRREESRLAADAFLGHRTASAKGMAAALSGNISGIGVLVVGACLAVLTAALIGLLIGQRVLNPLWVMVKVAGDVAEGKRDARVTVDSDNELGVLGRAMNLMADRLTLAAEKESERAAQLDTHVSLLMVAVDRVAKGDLAVEVPEMPDGTMSRLANGLRTSNESLRALVREIQRAGVNVASSATEMAAATREQEATLTEQAGASTTILASTREISATAQELSRSVSEITHSAEQAGGLAEQGQLGLGRLGTTMSTMVNASGDVVSKLGELHHKAGNINLVLTTISKVADQTNLLSLNAAIEAEKAGEHGRGFSVVATEIRRLADQTAVATLDIDRILREMQSSVSSCVMTMDRFNDEIRRNADEARTITGLLESVTEHVRALTPQVEYVDGGMKAQAVAGAQITEALAGFNDVMQQSVASLRSAREVVDQLDGSARAIQSSLKQFRVG